MIDGETKRLIRDTVIIFSVVVGFLFAVHGCNSTAAMVPLDAVLEKALADSLAAPTNSTPALIVGGDTNGAYVYPVGLCWNPSPDTNVVGYNTYLGVASRAYTNFFSVGLATNCNVILDFNSQYFFAVTAYNVFGIESAFSSEVSYGRWLPDRATITWPTNPPAALIISANPSQDRSKWTVALPATNSGTITVLLGPGSVFFALDGSTNWLYIRGWNPKNSI